MIEFQVARKPSKSMLRIVWTRFASGEKQSSPSGYTASLIAAEAQRRGMGFVLEYHPEFTAYTIQRTGGGK